MKKVCVVSTTRADYGLLYPLIEKLNGDSYFDLKILVSGTHLMQNYGNTIDEIIKDGFESKIIKVPVSENSTSQIFAETSIAFEKVLKEEKPDLVVLLGDRFEILAVASVCLFLLIPVAHISGGDLTFGAIDDACRHAITKLSNLHFTGNSQMAQRVIQMGEHPATVFNVGELGVENVLKEKLFTFEELKTSVDFNIEKGRFVIVTYHPETVCKESPKQQVKTLIEFIKEHNDYQYIVTKSNLDNGGDEINQMIEELIKEEKNMKFIPSLGRRRYLSALKYCSFVLGNSSSGIVETPYFKVPTINIGDRQEGRLQTKTILNCKMDKESLTLAFKTCEDFSFRNACRDAEQLYGDGESSKKIVETIKKHLNEGLSKKKYFYEIDEI